MSDTTILGVTGKDNALFLHRGSGKYALPELVRLWEGDDQ